MQVPEVTATPTPSPFLIEVVSDATNFWDSPLVGVIGALIGVAIGAALTFTFGIIQDNRKAKRELANRYLDEIKSASTEILRLSEEVTRNLFYWAQLARVEPHVLTRNSTQATLQAYVPAIAELSEQMDKTYASITLIAPKVIRDAAHEVFLQVYFSTALNTFDEEAKVKHAERMIGKMRLEFSKVVRQHFGVSD